MKVDEAKLRIQGNQGSESLHKKIPAKKYQQKKKRAAQRSYSTTITQENTHLCVCEVTTQEQGRNHPKGLEQAGNWPSHRVNSNLCSHWKDPLFRDFEQSTQEDLALIMGNTALLQMHRRYLKGKPIFQET